MAGPMSLTELSGLEKYAKDVLRIPGMRISALDNNVVLSVLAKGPEKTPAQEKKKEATSWLAGAFRKRSRDDDTTEAPSKRQAVRGSSLLEGTVKDAVAIAQRAAQANKQEVTKDAWECAARIASCLVGIKGVDGEAVCQGTTLHVSKPTGNKNTPVVVVAARLCGGVAIPLKEILSVGDKADGCVRVVRPGDGATSGSDLPCNDDGATQASVGGSALAVEIAVPECKPKDRNVSE